MRSSGRGLGSERRGKSKERTDRRIYRLKPVCWRYVVASAWFGLV